MKLKEDYNIEKVIGHYQVDDKKECPSFDVPKWLKKHNLEQEKNMEIIKQAIEHMWKDHKKIVIGAGVVVIILIIAAL